MYKYLFLPQVKMYSQFSQAQAHVFFGKLYRKQRSEKLQEQIENVVQKEKNIFARIKKIEALDASHTPPIPLNAAQRRQRKKLFFLHNHAKSHDYKNGAKASFFQFLRVKKKIGFWQRFMGKNHQSLAKWGTRTKVLHKGFFSRLELSPAAKQLFQGLKEEYIIHSLKAFRLAIANGWNQLDAAQYNTIYTAYKFFTEYIQLFNLFQRHDKAQKWLSQSWNMQKRYAALLHYQYEHILEEVFPKYISSVEHYAGFEASLRHAMRHIIYLDKAKPSMKEACIGIYALTHNTVLEWRQLEARLGSFKARRQHFCAPPDVKAHIARHVKALKQKQNLLHSEIQEIEEIRNKYLALDTDGNCDESFLDPLVLGYLKRSVSANSVLRHIVRSHKSQPHRLLFAILKDFHINYLPILTNRINVHTVDGQIKAVAIFGVNIFKEHTEIFLELLRNADIFQRKYPGLNYYFKEFSKNKEKKIFDPAIENLHLLLKDSNHFFHKIVFDLQRIMKNHKEACDLELSSGAQAKMRADTQKNKSTPLDKITQEASFLAYADASLISSERLNGKSIHDIIENILSYTYHYLYIFLDKNLHELLASTKARYTKAEHLQKEIVRLTGTDDDRS